MGVKLCKNVYIFSWATVTVDIYTATVACVFIILYISVRPNFSLSSLCTMTSAPNLLFLRCTQTHPQTNLHRNTPTHKQTHTDKPTERYGSPVKKGYRSPELGSWIGRWRKDLGRRAWFVDRPVKKGFGSSSLVRGSAGEERICVAGAWFVDRLMK